MIDRPDVPSLSSDSFSSDELPPVDNVVELQNTTCAQSSTTFQACADLYDYWQHLRGTRQMPARSEFDPRDITSALSATFVAEKVAPRVARIRVSGSVLNDTLGMDVRGMPITALFDPMARDTVAEAINDLFGGPSMVVLDLTSRRGFQRKASHARMLLLPMSDAAGNITRVVGCLDIEGELPKTPCRFKVSSLRQTEVTGEAPKAVQIETPFEPTMPTPETTRSFAFAENTVPFHQKRHDDVSRNVNELEGRANLRLVVDNDV